MRRLQTSEIIIAVIGLLGIFITNLDKIFPGDAYKNLNLSNNDINFQIRQFIELSGFRSSLDSMEKTRIEKYKLKYNLSEETVRCMFDLGIQNNQLVDITVESLKKHLTLDEIKELNKIYAGRDMIEYAKKQPEMMRDILTGIEEAGKRIEIRNNALSTPIKESSESCPTHK